MTTININDIVQTSKPWNLSLELDGVTYPVRRMSSTEFKRLSDSGKYTNDENLQFMASLFDGDNKPPLDSMNDEVGATVIGAIAAYYQQAVVAKNLTAAAEAVSKLLRR